MKKAITSGWLLLPLAAVGCIGGDDTRLWYPYDKETLQAYRSALPSEEQLVAGVPTAASNGSILNGDSAVLAGQGVVLARGVNDTARDIAHTLHTLAQKEPDRFSVQRERFTWGPWENPTGPGEMTLTVRRDASAEHEFSYELARQLRDQPETRSVVLWGAATPDLEDAARSSGYTALDLDANTRFELGHGGSEKAVIGQGRFAIAYGHTERGDGSVNFNVASFRGFIPPSEGIDSELTPVSVDHFYGRVSELSGSVVDFLHSEIEQNLCGTDPDSCFGELPGGHAEQLVFGEFFVDRGLGRADVSLSGGDLGDELQLSECWNPSLTRTSFRLTTSLGDQQKVPEPSCPGRTALSFQELGLPTRADVPEWLTEALDNAANGEH